jgi:hypothetical protein
MENSKNPVLYATYYEEWLLFYYYGSVPRGNKKGARFHGSLMYVEKW